MRRKINIAFLLLCLAAICKAEPTDISSLENVIYTDNVSCNAGSTVILSIKMKNAVAMTGFQFDIDLPAGVSISQDDGIYNIYLSTKRTTVKKTNYFDSVRQSDGSIRVMASSTKSYTFEGNDGEVITVELSVDKSADEGTHPLFIKNIVMSDASSKTYEVAKVESEITIGSNTPSAIVEANQFKTDYATILSKTTATVTSADLDDINAALSKYDKLSEGAKALLTEEKTLLDNLKAKADTATGLTFIGAVNVCNNIYDLNGRLISDSTKGLIIKNGKKIFVK